MNVIVKISIIIFLSYATSGCSKDDSCGCFDGTGKDITVERQVGEVRNIHLSDNINLMLVQDTTCALFITAGENIIKGIETRFENGTVFISNNNRCNWARTYKRKINAVLKIKHLNKIHYTGHGTISTLNTLTTDSLRIDSWDGAGDISIAIIAQQTMFNLHLGTSNLIAVGITGKNLIYSSAYGKVDCSELYTPFAFVTNRGTNDCYVNSTEHLIANIRYIGNIYFTGNPHIIETNYYGIGKVLQVD